MASADAFEDALARELARDLDDSADLALIRRADELRRRCTKVQLDLIDDPSKRKAARCPRRAGKTTAGLHYVGDYLPRHKDAVAWYIATKLKNARKLVWNPLRKLNREFSLGLAFHKTDASVTWPNEAQLWLAGADDDDSIADMLGHQPHLVVIDECGAFPPARFEYLINEVEPSLMDNDGTLLLISTPGTILAGLFYEITGPHGIQVLDLPDGRRALSRPYRERRTRAWKGVQYEWSLHTWTLKENTARPDLWTKAVKLKKEKGWSDANPQWRRQYLGEWTPPDARLRVIDYDEGRDTWTPGPATDRNPFGLPEDHSWFCLIGIDLGSYDPLAIQVGAWSYTSPLFLHVYEWEAPKLGVSELALKLEEVAALCGGWERITKVVADDEGLGGTILETLLQDHGIYVERANRKNKRDHIEIQNGELKDGRTKILRHSRLAAEMAHLQWDPKRPGKFKGAVPLWQPSGDDEQPRAAGVSNNNLDAWIYLAAEARERNTRQPTVQPDAATAARAAEVQRFLAARTKHSAPEPHSATIDWETTEWPMK